MGDVVDGRLTLLHALQQARLGLGRGPVDLVRQHDVGEHRAGAELEAHVLLVEHVDPGDVAREQVGRELDAREAAAHRARQGLGEQRLADARVVLDDHVPAGEQRDDARLDDLVLAEDDGADVAATSRRAARCRAPRPRSRARHRASVRPPTATPPSSARPFVERRRTPAGAGVSAGAHGPSWVGHRYGTPCSALGP